VAAKSNVTSIQALRDHQVGDPHALPDDRARLLWVLAAADALDPKGAYLAAAEAAAALRDLHRVDIPRQRAATLMEAARRDGQVAVQRRGRVRRYRIMKPGLDVLQMQTPGALYIDPEKALTEIRRFEDLLGSLTGSLCVCDPYLENKTLDYVAAMRAATEVRLLTGNILREPLLRRDLAAFRREHKLPLDIRVAPTGKLHDRYLIHDQGMVLIGTSLNGFAKKQSFVVNVGFDIRAATMVAFDRLWSQSASFG